MFGIYHLRLLAVAGLVGITFFVPRGVEWHIRRNEAWELLSIWSLDGCAILGFLISTGLLGAATLLGRKFRWEDVITMRKAGIGILCLGVIGIIDYTAGEQSRKHDLNELSNAISVQADIVEYREYSRRGKVGARIEFEYSNGTERIRDVRDVPPGYHEQLSSARISADKLWLRYSKDNPWRNWVGYPKQGFVEHRIYDRSAFLAFGCPVMASIFLLFARFSAGAPHNGFKLDVVHLCLAVFPAVISSLAMLVELSWQWKP